MAAASPPWVGDPAATKVAHLHRTVYITCWPPKLSPPRVCLTAFAYITLFNVFALPKTFVVRLAAVSGLPWAYAPHPAPYCCSDLDFSW